MKKNSILMLAFLIFTMFGWQTASAQFPISIPKLPKIKKDKPKPEDTTTIQDKPEDSTTPQAKSDEYDKQTFFNITWGNTRYIDPYLECYAEKHNLELIKVTDNAFSPPYYFSDMKKTLQEEQAKLGEIEIELKSKLKSRPNTGLPYKENPAIWEEITVNRAQYMQCAIADQEAKDIKGSAWLRLRLDDIAKRQKEVEDSTPDRGWLVQDYSDHLLLKAVSPIARNEWMKENIMKFKPYLDPPLDALAAAVAKKLPLFPADTKHYPFHNPAEEKLMKGKMGDLTIYKIFYSGLETANWLIDKNDLGIPIGRYKHGMIWGRNTSHDHPYCYAEYINIIQDYTGGGTYGASYARYIEYELIGCPVEK